MNQNPCNCGNPKREHFPVEHLKEITITKNDKMSFEPLPSQIPPQEEKIEELDERDYHGDTDPFWELFAKVNEIIRYINGK
jgi:hypothetical protein